MLAVDKIDGCDLSNKECYKMPAKEMMYLSFLSKYKVLCVSSKTEHFNYKGEWVYTYVVTHFNES